MAKKTIVIDPGHGGTGPKLGGSSSNNATSPSGIKEKKMTLDMAMLVRGELNHLAELEGHDISVLLTRETDVNLRLRDRAKVAKDNNADVFLSIHFNASTGHNARGVETLVRPANLGNTNRAADGAFAQRIQTAVFGAIKAHDPATRDREVKDQELGVLRRDSLGLKTRACLLEVEFIDFPAVDELLNTGPNAAQVQRDIAAAISRAIIDDIVSHE